jgi:hypothetical protein
MSLVSILLIVVGVAVLAVLGLAAAKPNTFRIVRLIRIKAPPEAVYPYVVDFHRWTEWSPYDALDGELKRTYSGADSGVGAAYAWEGPKLGIGHMEILQAEPSRYVGLDLVFEKPFKAHNQAEFTFEILNDPDLGHCTAVTWSMHGPASFMSKLMGVFMNIDKMVGKDFEQGLQTLKAKVEG